MAEEGFACEAFEEAQGEGVINRITHPSITYFVELKKVVFGF